MFEIVNEIGERGFGVQPLGEEVDVIGHEAVGMNGEVKAFGRFSEQRKCALSNIRVEECAAAFLAAERDEVDAQAEVVLRGQT